VYGDKVKVRSDLKEGKAYGSRYWNHHKQEYAGQIVTISYVGNHFYCIKNDPNNWEFTDEMFEPVEESIVTSLQKENKELKLKIEYLKGQLSVYEKIAFNN